MVLGVAWNFSAELVAAAAGLAAALGVHLVCAFVDPGSYLTELDQDGPREAQSLDPTVSDEAAFPAGMLRQRLETVLGPAGREWTFRVLNGAVAPSLARLSRSSGASLLVVGGPRTGLLAGMERFLEGSVSEVLTRQQNLPVLIVPCSAGNGPSHKLR